MAQAGAVVGPLALRRPGGADDDRAPPRRSGGRRAREFATRGWAIVLPVPAERAEAVAPLLRSTAVDVRSGDTTDLPACDPVVGVFFEALGGETGDAELRGVGALAAGAGRVHDAETVRSWPGSALVGSRRVGARNPTVGRAIE